MDQDVFLHDLAELICEQQTDKEQESLEFSFEQWPPELQFPPEGIGLGDLRVFVSSVLESPLLCSTGIVEFLGPFFSQFPDLEDVYLTRLEVVPGEAGGSAAFFVGFQQRDSLEIIHDSPLPDTPALLLNNPGFTIGSTGGPDPCYTVNVYGTLEIFGVALEVMAEWPGMVLTGTLVRELDLQKMLGDAGFQDQVTFGQDGGSALPKVRALMVRMDLSQKIFDFTLGMGEWRIVPNFSLNDLLMDLSIKPKGNSASVRAQINLCEIDIDMAGSFQDGQVEFSGSTGRGQELPIGQLIVDLNKRFGTGTGNVPAALSSLTFDSLSLVYNTGTANRFAFKGNASLEVDDTLVNISVDIDITGDKKEIGAQVIIGGEQFLVTFDRQTVSADGKKDGDLDTALIALYEHDSEQGNPPNLQYLAGLISSDLAKIVPAIEIHKAMFGYHTAKKGNVTTSAWLFGVELGTVKLTVSDPNLGVVRDLIGSELSLGVESPQLLLTTQALKKDVIASLPNLEKFKLPSGDLKSACLSANLTLGAQKYPLLMNLGEEQKETKPGASTEPTAAKPEPAAPAAQESAIAATPAGDVKWIKIQKQISVLYLDKIGVRYQEGRLGLLLGASLTAAGLTISLEGFSIDSPLGQLSPTFDLTGLGLRYRSGPVEISGSFLKKLKDGNIQYSGSALIKAKSFTLSAIGSYASMNGTPSLFIFALLDSPLGGPPCFFVTGLAAGFGYNTSVRIPAIEQVRDFPLLAAMVDPGKIGGKDASPMTVVESMGEWIPPKPGSFWLAAGISFRSFEIINSDVLAIAEFGQEFQMMILGFSIIKLPQQGTSYAYAELMLQILIKPAEGVVSALGLLTASSYLIDKACRLTGGFAFCVWFGNNIHAGDFVMTIGGYHPAFKAPDHYPIVPRVGFNWPVSGNVTIKGEAYFALTPSCVMAGAKLEVLFQSGELRAWFIAQADLIVYWKPFYFMASIYIRLGASYRLKIWFVRKTFSVELGASLELWGPPTGGQVHIGWWVLSFTISFGAPRRTGPISIDWDGFKSMLPQGKNMSQAPRSLDLAGESTGKVSTDPDLAVIQVSINNGLLQQVDSMNGKKLWIIRPDEFVFTVETAVPLKKAILANPDGEAPVSLTGRQEIGIRPMGIVSMATSEQTITIRSGDQSPVSFAVWEYDPYTRNMPEAMWGAPVVGEPKAEAKLIDDCLVGVKNIRLKPCETLSEPPASFMENALGYDPVDRQEDNRYPDFLTLSTAGMEPEQSLLTSDLPLPDIQQTLARPGVAKKRDAVLEALAGLGINYLTNGDLKTSKTASPVRKAGTGRTAKEAAR